MHGYVGGHMNDVSVAGNSLRSDEVFDLISLQDSILSSSCTIAMLTAYSLFGQRSTPEYGLHAVRP